jgi:AsmA protein
MMSGNVGKKFGALKVVVIAAILILAAIIALPFILDINQFRPELESRFTSALGREVKVGNLKLSLLSGSVEADDITIADNPDFSRSPFLTSESLQVSIELKQLIFSKEIRITRIILDRPAITLIHTSSGKWNFSDLTSRAEADGKKSSANSGHSSEMDIEIKELRITGGRITLIEGRKKPSVCDDVRLVADNLSYASSFPFSLTASLPGGGTLNLEGKAGPLGKKDTLRTPLTAALAVSHFDLVASGFVSAESGLSGLLDFSGTAISDGLLAQSKGYAQADKLQIVKSGAPASKPISLEYGVDYDLANQNGTLRDGKIQCGRAIAHLHGNYDRRDDNLILKMALLGKDMPLQDLTSLLPAFGVTLPSGASLEGGSLNVDLNAEGPIDRIVTTGTVDISRTRLVGFDLAGKMAGLTKLAGIESNNITEIEKFASAVRLTPEGTYVSDLLLIMPALGELTGEGKVATDRTLDFTMRAMLKPSGTLGAGLARLVKGGTLNVPFFVRGTASDPKFIPDIKNTATGLLESQLPGQGSNEGESNSGESLGNILRNLIKKKK